MASSIDPSQPASGAPASKATIRSNFAAAKAEIEALQELGGILDVRRYGTQTAALQAAVGEALADRNVIGISLPDGFEFDPSAVDWGTEQLAIFLHGNIYPTAVWELSENHALVGRGGTKTDQFQIATPARIHRHRSLTDREPTLRLSGQGSIILSHLRVVGGSGVGIEISAPLAYLERVGVAGEGIGIVIADAYWILLDECVVGMNERAAASILLTNNQQGSDTTGFIEVRGLRTKHAPILIDKGAGTKPFNYIEIYNWTMEIPAKGHLIRINEGAEVRCLKLHNCRAADAELFGLPPLTEYLLNKSDRVWLVQWEGLERVVNTQKLMSGTLPVETRWLAGQPPLGRWSDAGDYPRRPFLIANGELETSLAYRGLEPLQSHPFSNLDVSRSGPWDASSTYSETTAIICPFGLPRARRYRLTVASVSNVRFLYFRKLSLAINDWLIFGIWFRNMTPANNMDSSRFSSISIRSQFQDELNLLDGERVQGIDLDPRVGQQEVGWAPIVRPYRVTATDGSGRLTFQVQAEKVGTAFDLWGPFVLHADGSAWTAREVMRVASTVTNPIGPAGLAAVDEEMALRVGRGPSTHRPRATEMGAGAIWYDTAIDRMIVSDGSVWRDFTGNPV